MFYSAEALVYINTAEEALAARMSEADNPAWGLGGSGEADRPCAQPGSQTWTSAHFLFSI